MWSCFGCQMICPNTKFAMTSTMMWNFADADLCRESLNLPNRMIMTNIYPGFDKATHVPPNFVQTGPIMDPDLSVPRDRLERKDPELFAWMTEAQENNEVLIKSMIKEKILTVKAGQNVIRMLPPLILEMKHVDEAINKIDKAFSNI